MKPSMITREDLERAIREAWNADAVRAELERVEREIPQWFKLIPKEPKREESTK